MSKTSDRTRSMEMKITKVTKTYFETEGERVYFFEPLDEEMSITELQELMDENEKFLLKEIQKMKKEPIKQEGKNEVNI